MTIDAWRMSQKLAQVAAKIYYYFFLFDPEHYFGRLEKSFPQQSDGREKNRVFQKRFRSG